MFNNSNQRSYESPMEFEWDNNQGPVDVTSPFHQLSKQNGLRRGFDSPSKPVLRPQTSSFFSAQSATTATPFRNPSFTTPRKPFDADLFSEASGAESSPADNADTEDTPEIPVKTKPMAFFKAEKKPVFGKYGAGFQGTSPGRHDLRRGKYAEVVQKASAAQKARKRKRFDRDYQTSTRGNYETESENEDVRQRHISKSPREYDQQSDAKQDHYPHKPSWFTNFLDGLAARPHLPLILSYYVQVGINAFLGGSVMLVIYKVYSSVRADIHISASKAIARMHAEVAKCTEEWTINQCAPATRVPQMKDFCDNLEVCMHRDPSTVGYSASSLRMLSDMLSEFADGMTLKAIVLFLAIIALCLYANNAAFSGFRARAMEQQHQYYSQPPPPHPYASHQYEWDVPPPQVPLPPTPKPISNEYHDYGMGSPTKSILPSQGAQRSPRKGSRI